MRSTQRRIWPCSQRGFFPLISLLLVQTMKTISILLLCLHWCDQERFCTGFTRLELEVSAWHSDWNNVDPREPKTVQKQHFTFRQYPICVTEQEMSHSKICTFKPILTDSIMFTCYCLFSKSLPVIVIQYIMCSTGLFPECLDPVFYFIYKFFFEKGRRKTCQSDLCLFERPYSLVKPVKHLPAREICLQRIHMQKSLSAHEVEESKSQPYSSTFFFEENGWTN